MLQLQFLSYTLPILLLAAGVACQQAESNFGHARTRELAELGRLPGARDVVVRDLVNYHRHRLPLPTAQQDVAFDARYDRSTALAGDDVWLQVGYTTAPQGDRALARPCAVALVAITGASEGTLQVRVHRGKALLRQQLGAQVDTWLTRP